MSFDRERQLGALPSSPGLLCARTHSPLACTAMKSILVSALLLLLSQVTEASEGCALRVARLFADGNLPELQSLFKQSDLNTQNQLLHVISKAGHLSDLSAAKAQRFERSYRFSATASNLPASRWSHSFRVNATSSMLGPVQLHVEIEPDSECTLVALHLEVLVVGVSPAKIASAAQPVSTESATTAGRQAREVSSSIIRLRVWRPSIVARSTLR
jgi:hypothetical protein